MSLPDLKNIHQYFKEYMAYVLLASVGYLFFDNSKLHTKIESIYEKIVVENKQVIKENTTVLQEVKEAIKKN